MYATRVSHSTGLFDEARRAYESTLSKDMHEPFNSVALAAILFAAAALEAFSHDFMDQIPEDESFLRLPEEQYAVELRTLLRQAEDTRIPTPSKFLLIGFMIPGQPLKSGTDPYDRISLLFDVRNSIMHAKPQTLNKKLPKIIERLRSYRVLATNLDPTRERILMTRICTRAMALWACNVVTDVVTAISKGVIGAVPSVSPGLSFSAESWPDAFCRVDQPKPDRWPWLGEG